MEWEEEQTAIQDEKFKSNETYDFPAKHWEEINPAPFITTEKKFVICIDTLGQDR